MDNRVDLPVLEDNPSTGCCGLAGMTSILGRRNFVLSLLGMCFTLLAISGFLLGRISAPKQVTPLPPELLQATATHAGADMAVATGRIDEETEGVYFLDFKTGDLSCWVYYPRFMQFGAKYMCNVTEQLAATKNAEYLLVTGTIEPPPASSNNRPAGSLIYVVDTKSGQFASYTVAANRAMESAGQPQVGPIVFVGGGEVRAPSAGSARRTIPNGAANAGQEQGANGAAPNAPANPQDNRNNRRNK